MSPSADQSSMLIISHCIPDCILVIINEFLLNDYSPISDKFLTMTKSVKLKSHEKQQNPSSLENDLITNRRIRKTVGYLGINLPFLLLILLFIPFFKTSIQNSISY